MFKISILGKANTGKNTVSKILRELISNKMDHFNIDQCKLIAFADPIKEIALKMFPHIPKKHLFGSSKYRSETIKGATKDGKLLTVRQLLIDIGTQGREYNENIWIENYINRFDIAQKNGATLIITPDVRFVNEHTHLKANNFFQIRLLRGTQNKIDHISETGQDMILDSSFDYVLYNNKTLTDLREDIETNIIPKLK